MSKNDKISINIIGKGVMGLQVAAFLHTIGHDLELFARSDYSIKQFNAKVKLFRRHFGVYNPGKITFHTRMSNFPNNITIESIAENLQAKKELYSVVRQSNDKLFFTNSSSYSPNEIANDVWGMHFFNPIIALKIIEVCISNDQITDDLRILISSFEKKDYHVIRVKPNRGYIGNFIIFHEISSVFKLIELYGYLPDDINKMYSYLYENRNIFYIIDLIGIDIVDHILENLHVNDSSFFQPKTFKRALSAGVLGKKNKTSICDLFIDKGEK
jgi:3-hydroxyacyl-CoA dehydrogenase